jgi:hypothetical protein
LRENLIHHQFRKTRTYSEWRDVAPVTLNTGTGRHVVGSRAEQKDLKSPPEDHRVQIPIRHEHLDGRIEECQKDLTHRQIRYSPQRVLNRRQFGVLPSGRGQWSHRQLSLKNSIQNSVDAILIRLHGQGIQKLGHLLTNLRRSDAGKAQMGKNRIHQVVERIVPPPCSNLMDRHFEKDDKDCLCPQGDVAHYCRKNSIHRQLVIDHRPLKRQIQ